jgi:hypothetical protein
MRVHGEELPAQFTKQASDSEEPGRLAVLPANHFKDALAKTFDQAAFGVPALLGFCIDEQPLSPSAVAACGVPVAGGCQGRHAGSRLARYWREDARVDRPQVSTDSVAQGLFLLSVKQAGAYKVFERRYNVFIEEGANMVMLLKEEPLQPLLIVFCKVRRPRCSETDRQLRGSSHQKRTNRYTTAR